MEKSQHSESASFSDVGRGVATKIELPPIKQVVTLDLPVDFGESIAMIGDSLHSIRSEIAALAEKPQQPIITAAPYVKVEPKYPDIHVAPSIANAPVTVNVMIPWQVTALILGLLCGILAMLLINSSYFQ